MWMRPSPATGQGHRAFSDCWAVVGVIGVGWSCNGYLRVGLTTLFLRRSVGDGPDGEFNCRNQDPFHALDYDGLFMSEPAATHVRNYCSLGSLLAHAQTRVRRFLAPTFSNDVPSLYETIRPTETSSFPTFALATDDNDDNAHRGQITSRRTNLVALIPAAALLYELSGRASHGPGRVPGWGDVGDGLAHCHCHCHCHCSLDGSKLIMATSSATRPIHPLQAT